MPDLAQLASAPAGSAVRFDVDFDHGALVTAGSDGVKRWGDDPATLAPEQEVSLARFADGSLLAGTSTLGPHARIFSHVPVQASAALDATHVIAVCDEHVVSVRDASWAVTATFKSPVEISALAVDDTGHILTGHTDGSMRTWSPTGMPLVEIAAHNATI